jgi:hypothetical protein
MAAVDPIHDLVKASAQMQEARFVSELDVQVGGVDSLGLRQTNFDMMDRLLPGLNNVARHIRPFVVMCWARWKVKSLVDHGASIVEDILNDFVDRIEALYVWSQVLCSGEASLPGSSLVDGQIIKGKWVFGGPRWDAYRARHKASTSLSAALNYGPGLRNLGWVRAVEGAGSLTIPTEAALPAVMALDGLLGDLRNHPALSKLGRVDVDANFAAELGAYWSVSGVTRVEREVAATLIGKAPQRVKFFDLLEDSLVPRNEEELDTIAIRRGASDTDDSSGRLRHLVVIKDWRALQTRQLFRLTLEALFYWIIGHLDAGPATSDLLAKRYVESVGLESDHVGDWFFAPRSALYENPVDGLSEMESALESKNLSELACVIQACLRFCFVEPTRPDWVKERADRLPIYRAQQFVQARAKLGVVACVKEVFEHWIFAQHSYWCTGRGLADARAGGKTLLRLRIALEESGWCLLPGATLVVPAATPDRLETALSLMRQWRGG